MGIVNIHEAKTHLSCLVERAAQGETIVIAKAGRPIAKLVAMSAEASRNAKRLGFLKGEFKVPQDFDHLGEQEVECLFGR